MKVEGLIIRVRVRSDEGRDRRGWGTKTLRQTVLTYNGEEGMRASVQCKRHEYTRTTRKVLAIKGRTNNFLSIYTHGSSTFQEKIILMIGREVRILFTPSICNEKPRLLPYVYVYVYVYVYYFFPTFCLFIFVLFLSLFFASSSFLTYFSYF